MLCIWNNLSLTYHVNPFAQDTRLILYGPKRGLALLDAMHVEIDLKIKGRHGQDRELSKGVLLIKGTVHRSLKECKLETNSLSTKYYGRDTCRCPYCSGGNYCS